MSCLSLRQTTLKIFCLLKQQTNVVYQVVFVSEQIDFHGDQLDQIIELSPPVASLDDIAQLLWDKLNENMFGDDHPLPRNVIKQLKKNYGQYFDIGRDYILIKPDYARDFDSMINIRDYFYNAVSAVREVSYYSVTFDVYAYDIVGQEMILISENGQAQNQLQLSRLMR